MSVLPSLNSIRVGVNVLVQGEPHQVLWSNFVRMQQRKPVMQTKLRNLRNGKVLEMTFKPGDSVEEADLQKRRSSYLYRDANGAYFMDSETYDSVQIDTASLGDRVQLLQEGMPVDIVFFNEAPISVSLPPKIELKVTSAPPPVRGDSASNVTKSVTLETGVSLNVPLFIKEGDIIRINTESVEYVERVT